MRCEYKCRKICLCCGSFSTRSIPSPTDSWPRTTFSSIAAPPRTTIFSTSHKSQFVFVGQAKSASALPRPIFNISSGSAQSNFPNLSSVHSPSDGADLHLPSVHNISSASHRRRRKQFAKTLPHENSATHSNTFNTHTLIHSHKHSVIFRTRETQIKLKRHCVEAPHSQVTSAVPIYGD